MSRLKYRFLWISDTHIELARWGAGEPAATVNYINTLGAEFVLNSGDLVDLALAASYDTYLATFAPLTPLQYSVPGNHDEAAGAFAVYETKIGPAHFTPFTMRGLHFIGIVPTVKVELTGQLSSAELSYLETQLKAVGDASPVVVCHWPAIDDFGADKCITTGAEELLTLLKMYKVQVYLSGHVHGAPQVAVRDGTTHVLCGTFVPTAGDTTDSYVLICDVYADHISVSAIRGVSPWDERTSFDIPCAITRGATWLHLAGVHEED